VAAIAAADAFGLAVFAGPVGGLAPLIGPIAGYLFGFVAAAFVTGWLSERGCDRSVPRLFAAMGLGHIIILGCGFAWLAFGMKLGLEKAWLVGIAPFVAASVIKNALGAPAGAGDPACTRTPRINRGEWRATPLTRPRQLILAVGRATVRAEATDRSRV
jgi:biotin transporter BioY